MLDAVNLAWKLAAVTAGWAPPGLLDTYHSERHFAGTRALLQTQAQVALRRLGALIAGTSIRYPMPGPGQHALAGTFAPDLTLRTGPGPHCEKRSPAGSADPFVERALDVQQQVRAGWVAATARPARAPPETSRHWPDHRDIQGRRPASPGWSHQRDFSAGALVNKER
jgi:hypothetical protein